MVLAKTPEEKYLKVKEAYITDIIPSIRVLHEEAKLVRESFLVAHCAILSLSGFYAGSKNTGGATYRKFVADFFPKEYEPDSLWRDLRNGLVHAYTFTSRYILAHGNPRSHQAIVENVKSERTGELANFIVLNFENFLEDLEQAAVIYFETTKKHKIMMEKLCYRFDCAPPVSYVRNEGIAPGGPLAFLRDL